MENKTNFETIEDLVEVSAMEETTVVEGTGTECEIPQLTVEGNPKGAFFKWIGKKVGQAAVTILVYELGKKGAKKVIYKGKSWLEARKQAKLAAKQAKLNAESDVIVEIEEDVED